MHLWIFMMNHATYAIHGETMFSVMYSRMCRFNAVQYNMILPKTQQYLGQNISQNLHSQKTPHISPSLTGEIWGVYCEGLGKITAV